MSTKRFCDGCEDELTEDNNFGKTGEFDHEFQITDRKFSFRLTFGSNANGNRIVQGDGDICTSCVQAALVEHLQQAGILPDPNAEDEPDDIADAFAEDDDDGN